MSEREQDDEGLPPDPDLVRIFEEAGGRFDEEHLRFYTPAGHPISFGQAVCIVGELWVQGLSEEEIVAEFQRTGGILWKVAESHGEQIRWRAGDE